MSAKPGLFQPFEQMVAGLLCAELRGKNSRIKERRETRDDRALALSVLGPVHFGIGGCKKRMGDHLVAASGAAGEGAVAGLDGFVVAAEEIIRLA